MKTYYMLLKRTLPRPAGRVAALCTRFRNWATALVLDWVGAHFELLEVDPVHGTDTLFLLLQSSERRARKLEQAAQEEWRRFDMLQEHYVNQGEHHDQADDEVELLRTYAVHY